VIIAYAFLYPIGGGKNVPFEMALDKRDNIHAYFDSVDLSFRPEIFFP